MIQEQDNAKAKKTLKNVFRCIGPLDAYIYQHRDNDADVETSSNNVLVHPLTVPSLPLPIEQNETMLLSEQIPTTHIFTDGACTNNGKRNANAAWGFIVVDNQGYKVLERGSGPIPKSEPQTNQRAELQALLNGLNAAKQYPGFIKMWSDSQYSINCASVWGKSWQKKGWTKQGGVIQHLDLVKQLVSLTEQMGHRLEYKWLKGHKAGSAQYEFPWMFNHQVDSLATSSLATSY
jgi:ribonuclease HI